MKINICVILRLVLGAIFLASGTEKLLSHYQNFLYVIQGYQLFPEGWLGVEVLIARMFPWIELVTGILLVLGLYTAVGLRTARIMSLVFLGVVGQALIRQLPIDECGCFGSLISFPPQAVLLIDVSILLISSWLLLRPDLTTRLSLDQRWTPSCRSSD